MLSFWEKKNFLSYDIIIVGAGINGLSAACAIKEKHPNKSVLILERGSWPVGASTRNAGFACFGSFAEIQEDIQNTGIDRSLQIVEWRVKGMAIHKRRLGEKKMGFIPTGGGEFLLKGEPFHPDQLKVINTLLFPILHQEVFKTDNSKIRELGFNPEPIEHYISNACEGQIDPGLLMRNLWEYASELGILIMNGTKVIDFSDTGKGCEVVTHHTVLNENPVFTCQTLVFCTNAFSERFFPDLNIEPGRGQIIATKPIKGLPFKGVFHFNKGFYYFRDFENRVIFGGGRNLDTEKEKSTDIHLNPDIQDQLDNYLKTIIIPGLAYEIDSRWAGIMAFGKDKSPIIQRISPHVIVGVRMGGMGLALSGIVSEKIAEMI